MKQISLENLKVVVKDATTQDIISQLDLYSFNFAPDGNGNCILTDGKESVKVSHTGAEDEDGNAFASEAELSAYLSEIIQQTPDLGKSISLGNNELSSTGISIKFINKTTGEQSFPVLQRTDPVLGTTSTFIREQTTGVEAEDSSNAYQSLSVHTGKGSLNSQGRYALPIDIEVLNNTFIHEYRSKLNTTIDNLNIKIFEVTQSPNNLDNYRVLAGTDIVAGWYISKKAYWQLNPSYQEDSNSNIDIASGDSALPFDEGFSLSAGSYYRFVISGDNDFEFEGVNGAPNPFGGTQFIPYIERSFTGEIETKIVTEGASIHNTDLDFYRDGTNTTIILSNGQSYPVNTIKAIEDNGTIKLVSVDTDADITFIKQINHDLVSVASNVVGGSVTNVVNQLNQLFAVQPLGLGGDYISTLPTLAGTAITANFAEGQDPISDSIYSVGTDTSQHSARVWSDETVDEPGEYYDVELTGKGQFMLGFADASTGSANLTQLTTNSGNGHSGYLWANAFYNYGSYIAPWTTYGSNSGLSYGPGWNGSTSQQMRYNTIVQDNLANANTANPVRFRVKLTNEGYMSVWYLDEGRSNKYIMTARSTYKLGTAYSSEKKVSLVVKLVNGSVELINTPTRTATDPVAPILTYRYVESNGFDYPLFSTAEEANYVDIQNGGAGSSSIEIYPDDTTNTQWHRPATGFTRDAVSAPTDTIDITWNEIPTTTLIPSAYADNTIEVNEGSSINLSVDPQDHGWITTVTGDSWLNYSNGNVVGTAPQVTGDNVSNPYDEYTFTIIRTSEGSTPPGTLTIRVLNLTAPVNPITGFNHVAGTTAMVDSDTMGDGSVVQLNTQVADGERFVIEQAYIETNILPNLVASGDQYIIGLHNTTSDFSTLEIADFDAAIVWEYESATSHTFKFYRDGSVVQNIVINSSTDAYYDYAIESNGTSAWLIACNVNSIMNEASPADGGSFSHAYEVTNVEDTAPLQIHIAALNTTADISLTDIETITTPTPAPSSLTSWTKALDFSGGEYARHVNNSMFYQPLQMAGLPDLVPAHSTQGYTANNASSRPWATVVVFKSDGHNDNQMIWNQGEGNASGSDNIFVNVTGSGNVNFGWGREGVGYNQCRIATGISTSTWYAVYVAHSGERLGGGNASPSNLADCFDIRIMSSADSFTSLSSNLSIAANWFSAYYRMDRTVAGEFTVGGRGAFNLYSYRGKVASMVVHCLKAGVLMPDATEIELMITDPLKWEADYLIGNSYRRPFYSNSSTNYQKQTSLGFKANQMWFMGDGTPDTFPNINNEQRPNWLNYTYLVMTGMVSNDKETVGIPGLSQN